MKTKKIITKDYIIEFLATREYEIKTSIQSMFPIDCCDDSIDMNAIEREAEKLWEEYQMTGVWHE